jgi:hypothetical protein
LTPSLPTIGLGPGLTTAAAAEIAIHGWIVESVHSKETLPIGSHSTIYGLAYKGGPPTLSAFVVALVLTLAALVWRFLSYSYGDPRRSRALIAIGLALSLAAYCKYEAIFNLTLPCLFLFTWIGASLGVSHVPKPNDGGMFAPSPKLEETHDSV